MATKPKSKTLPELEEELIRAQEDYGLAGSDSDIKALEKKVEKLREQVRILRAAKA